jgi:putative hydrolase of the HAD superfamily
MDILELEGQRFENVKNIVFDLGGVIVTIDYNETINKFKKLGITNFDHLYGQYAQSDVFDRYDKGFATPDEFRTAINKLAHINVNNEVFDDAWNAMILDLPSENLEVLNNLKNNYKIYLLSNTNEIHLDYFFGYLKDKHSIDDFAACFHNVHYSCRMGMRKPDAEIYNKLIELNNLKPAETLFIDDTNINVDAAINAGWKGFYMPKGKLIKDIFSISH